MKFSLKIAFALLASALLSLPGAARAADYVIDTKGAHASINFRVKHLGFSWLTGRFDEFSGEFSFDENNPQASSVAVTINTASVNSAHAERDKHLRNEDFLHVDKFPQSRFVSRAIEVTGKRTARITGDLTLRGVTREIAIDAVYIGGGSDPWGGFRQGFSGTTSFAMADFGVPYDLGPASRNVELTLHVEGIRK